jgi:hypothetical protein
MDFGNRLNPNGLNRPIQKHSGLSAKQLTATKTNATRRRRRDMTETVLNQFVSSPKGMQLFQQERLIAAITELMCRTMKECDVKRNAMAEHLGKSKGWVSQILTGEANLTLRTVADFFTALNKRLSVSIEDISQEQAPLRCVTIAFNAQSLDDAWQFPQLAAQSCANLQMAG